MQLRMTDHKLWKWTYKFAMQFLYILDFSKSLMSYWNFYVELYLWLGKPKKNQFPKICCVKALNIVHMHLYPKPGNMKLTVWSIVHGFSKELIIKINNEMRKDNLRSKDNFTECFKIFFRFVLYIVFFMMKIIIKW